MPITEAQINEMRTLIAAAFQRLQHLYQLASALWEGAVLCSPDGTYQLSLTASQKAELASQALLIAQQLDEISAKVKAAIA